MKKGLCLPGGGIKRAAHIGVIKVLEEKISIDCITSSIKIMMHKLYNIGKKEKNKIKEYLQK